MKYQLTYPALLLCATLSATAQTGPAGVGNSTSNILWLRADNITGVSDGGDISLWADTSGNNEDATQADAGTYPTYVESSADLNDLPAVRFDGTAQVLDLSLSGAASDYSVYIMYHSPNDDQGHIIDIQSGRLVFAHNRGAGKGYNEGGSWRGNEITGTDPLLAYFELNNAGASIFVNGYKQDSSLSYTQRALGGNQRIGSNNGEGGQFFEGDIAEIIMFNTVLNQAQRRIIENYISTKYGHTIPNDYFGYDGSHGKDVAGIGRIDGSNEHNSATSGKIFNISNPNSLEDNDWLLFGHDGGAFSSWTTGETPGDSIKRIAREWRMDKTNDVGTVTISLDTAYLPAKPAGYSKYVLWIDADGDFTTGATQTVMTLNGGYYEVTGVTIAEGDFVTFGTLRPVIQFTTATASGGEATTPVTVSVSLNYKVESNVSVNYVVNDGSSTATEGIGNDFIRSDSSVTINAGSTTTSFNIAIENDVDEETGETIVIDLSGPTAGITLGPTSTYTYTINDNDAARNVEFPVATLNQSEDSTSVTVSVEIDAIDAGDTVRVDYAVTGGTATGSGTDYTLASGTAKVNPGDTATTFSFSVVDDNEYENNETIIITLSNPSAGTNVGTNNTFTYTINNEDSAPEIEFSLTSSSGSEGSSLANITVAISAQSGKDATVNYIVTGGTATGGGTDYTLASGSVTVTTGTLTKDIVITVIDDPDLETAETIRITLSSPTDASLGADSVHIFTILDNDNLGDAGPGGVGDYSSNILWLRADDITGVSDGADIMTWPDTSGNNADPTQGAGGNQPNWDQANSDFNNKSSVTFNGSSDYFDASALTHASVSDYDIYFVYKTTSTSIQYPFHTSNGTIRLHHEGGGNGAFSDGTNRGAEITGTNAMLVNWRLNDAGADIYVDGSASQTSLTYVQRAIGGNRSLGANSGGTNRYFNGNIAEAIFFNKVVNKAQRVIIENYLAAKYGLSISNDKYNMESTHGYEVAGIGSEGSGNFHAAAESGKILKVAGATSLDSTDYLIFGHDNASIASWDTSDIPGDSVKRVAREWRFDETGDVGTITLSVDTSFLPAKPAGYSRYVVWLDDDGTFSDGATQYVLGLNGGRYEVAGVDIADGNYITFGVLKPVIQFSDTASSEAEYASTGTMEVSLNYALNSTVTVNYAVTGGTATGGGDDYILASGTATITAGNTTATFDVTIVDDEDEEDDETVIVSLSSPSYGVTIGEDTSHTLTINDDDAPRNIAFQIDSTGGSEATSPVTVTVELDIPDMVDTVTVDYAVTSGTADGGGTDYTLASGMIQLLPGDTIGTFDFTVNNELVYEDDEYFIVTLSNPSSGVNIGTISTYKYTIVDNDNAPTIEYSTTSGSGSEGTASVNVEVYLSAVTEVDATVNYAVSGGSATGGGDDYTLASGTATITAGSTTTNIVVTITDDPDIESDETIEIDLSGAVDATLGDDTIYTYTIGDNDNLGSVGPGGVGDNGSNILWLRADAITGVADGADITTWADTSGNDNDPTQPAATKPSWDQVNTDFNNLPSVHFDGSSEFFDLSALTNAASDYDVFAVYKATTQNRQWLFNAQNGTLIIAHEGNTNEGAFDDGTARGTEITSTGPQIVEWMLDDAGANIYIDGDTMAGNQGLTYVQRAIGGNVSLGSNNAGTNRYFNGDMAEVIMFNKALNPVQRILINNYLAAKYALSITNDKFSYESTHGNEVAGIGSMGLPDIHTAGYSAGILEISNASSLDSSDYLLFGHNNGSIASWTATETPFAEVTRIAREWRLDETGDVGTVTITLDTTLLPARTGGYNGYVVMIDADGDFSSGASIYPLTLVSGSKYKADNVEIADSDYVTFGTGRYLSATTGNFNSTSTWLAGSVPGSGQSAYIAKGTTVTLSANQTVGSINIITGGTLNIGSYTLSIDNATITNYGIIIFGTGTVNYSRTGAQNVATFSYNNLIISGSGTKTLTDDITVNGNLTLSSGTLDVDNSGNYGIDIKGNWINSGGSFTAQTGTVTFSGISDQQVTSNANSFYNVIISNTGTEVSLNDDLSVTNLLTLSDGVISTTTSYWVTVSSSSATSIGGYSSASFINGNLRRYIATNSNTYVFPVGNGTGTTNYYRADLINNNLTGLTYIESQFKALTGHVDDSLDVADTWESGSLTYTTVNTAGVWILEPNTAPSGGSYNIKLYIANMTGFTDNNFGPLKRPVGSTNGKDWTTGGGTLNNNDQPGRTVASGYMQRNGLTDFSEHGAGGGSGGGAGLPIQLLSFTATANGNDVKIGWVTATEINNDFFTVERSQDAITFETLGNFEAAGNSSESRYYSTNDRNPLQGTSYYRLKQTDFDGTFTYSNVVAVVIEEQSSISVAPNPVTNRFLNLIVSGHSLEHFANSTFTLNDMAGRLVFNRYIKRFERNKLSVKIPKNISPGIYIAKLMYGEDEISWKVVIK